MAPRTERYVIVALAIAAATAFAFALREPQAPTLRPAYEGLTVRRRADDGFQYPSPARAADIQDVVTCGCGCPLVSDFLCSR